MGVLDELFKLASVNYNETVKAWKESGNKVLGYYCSYIPAEIIYAAKLMPYRLKGLGAGATYKAEVYLASSNCMWCRSILQLAFDGEYDFLDGLIASNQCDHSRRTHELWVRKVGIGFDHFLTVPHKTKGEGVLNWYKNGLYKLKSRLEDNSNK